MALTSVDNTTDNNPTVEKEENENKNITEIITHIPKPPRFNYESISNQNMMKVFRLMVEGHNVLSIADIMKMHPRNISNYKRRITETFGTLKDMLDTQSLYTEIQTTKSSIKSDIDILRQIAIDKTIPSSDRIKAVEASIDTKILLLRVEFDGKKVIAELKANEERNKEIIDDYRNLNNNKNKYLILPNNNIENNNDDENSKFKVSDGIEPTQSINERTVTTKKEDAGPESKSEHISKVIINSEQYKSIIEQDSNFQV